VNVEGSGLTLTLNPTAVDNESRYTNSQGLIDKARLLLPTPAGLGPLAVE
jgi:hypothetical protein